MYRDSVLHVMLFSGWRMSRGHDVIDVPSRSQRLVALLAIRGRQPRTALAGELWPEVDEHRAHSSLRAAVYTLHRMAPEALTMSNGYVQLAPEVRVDVDDFRTHAYEVLSAGVPVFPGSLDHPTVAGGDLLPGWYDDWVLIERERIHQSRLHVLEALATMLTEKGAYAQAMDVALRAVELDPLRESAHRAVIQVHLAEGNLVDAVREYERFRALLRAELGVAPTHRITSLVQGALQPR